MRRTLASRSRQGALGLFAAALVASAGCSNLIGLDSYEEVDEAASERGGRGNTGGARQTGGNAPAGGSTPAGGNCDVAFFDSACRSCIRRDCAVECGGCSENSECVSLLSCINDCAGTANCLEDCELQHPSGRNDFLNLFADDACAFTLCEAECAPESTEAPCDTSAECGQDFCALETGGGWCTRYCGDSSECPGVCAPVGDDAICFVPCTSNADCAAFPATSCQAYFSVEGEDVGVCHP